MSGVRYIDGERCSSFEARIRDEIATRLSNAQERALLAIWRHDETVRMQRATLTTLAMYGLIQDAEWTFNRYCTTPRGAWVAKRRE